MEELRYKLASLSKVSDKHKPVLVTRQDQKAALLISLKNFKRLIKLPTR